jgi:hypothetical protein
MHIFWTYVLIFNFFGVFYMFRTRGFIFGYTVVYTVMVWSSVFYMHHQTCIYTYNCLPEDEPSGSKHIEDTKN